MQSCSKLCLLLVHHRSSILGNSFSSTHFAEAAVLCRSTVDAVFFAYVLRSYSRTNKYTAAILAYVLGAGVFTVAAAPNFARLFKRQQEDEGALCAEIGCRDAQCLL